MPTYRTGVNTYAIQQIGFGGTGAIGDIAGAIFHEGFFGCPQPIVPPELWKAIYALVAIHMIVDAPLVATDSEGLVPTLVRDAIFTAPKVRVGAWVQTWNE